MTEIHLQISDELLTASLNDPEKLSKEILISTAVKLYEAKKLSSGKAAQIAGICRVAFFEELGKAGVPLYQAGPEEFSAELALLRRG